MRPRQHRNPGHGGRERCPPARCLRHVPRAMCRVPCCVPCACQGAACHAMSCVLGLVPCHGLPAECCCVPCAVLMCYLPCTTCHQQRAACHVQFAMHCVPCAVCHVLCAVCDVPCATCHVLHALFHAQCHCCVPQALLYVSPLGMCSPLAGCWHRVCPCSRARMLWPRPCPRAALLGVGMLPAMGRARCPIHHIYSA